MQNEWMECDDWKQITSNLVAAEGLVFGFDAMLERWRVQIGSLIALILLLSLLFALVGAMLAVNLLRNIESPVFEMLPACMVLLLYGMTTSFMQLQKMRQLRAEANLARAAQEIARRRVLDRDLGVRQ